MTSDMPDRVFERAAEIFSPISAPTRLHILCELCIERGRRGAPGHRA